MYKRRGSLFIHSFKRKEIENEDYFTKVIHYIHTNPVHHGFVKAIMDWPWSSYQDVQMEKNELIRYHEIIEWFGGKQRFIDFHQQPINMKFDE